MMVTFRFTLGLLAAVVAAAGANAAAVVVDDFESYATGDLDVVAPGDWTAEHAGMSQIAADAGNQYLVYAGTSTDWAHNYRAAGAQLTTKGTLSFRVYVEDDAGTDHAIGLTDSSDTIDFYSDYGPYIRITDDTAGGSGVAALDTRDGGGFVDDIAILNAQQWYDIDLVIDTAGGDSGAGGFDIYVDGSLVYANSDFRRGYGAPLENLLLMGGSGAAALVRVDDVTLDVVPEPAAALLLLLPAAIACGRRCG